METVKRAWSGCGFIGKLSICCGALAILMCVVAGFASDTAQAQEPEPEYIFYFPIIHYSPPWPYNVKAADFVMQPADVPPGYELDEEESGPAYYEEGSCGEYAVDVYLVVYWNYELLFSGTPAIADVAAVYRTPQAATVFVQCMKEYAAGHPDFSRFMSVPRMGDETLAYEFVSEDGSLSVTGHSILVRKGNLITHIATAAFSPFADFNVAKESAKMAYARLENEIAGLNTEGSKMSGDSLKGKSKETGVRLEPVKELLESQIPGQWGSLH